MECGVLRGRSLEAALSKALLSRRCGGDVSHENAKRLASSLAARNRPTRDVAQARHALRTGDKGCQSTDRVGAKRALQAIAVCEVASPKDERSLTGDVLAGFISQETLPPACEFSLRKDRIHRAVHSGDQVHSGQGLSDRRIVLAAFSVAEVDRRRAARLAPR